MKVALASGKMEQGMMTGRDWIAVRLRDAFWKDGGAEWRETVSK